MAIRTGVLRIMKIWEPLDNPHFDVEFDYGIKGLRNTIGVYKQITGDFFQMLTIQPKEHVKVGTKYGLQKIVLDQMDDMQIDCMKTDGDKILLKDILAQFYLTELLADEFQDIIDVLKPFCEKLDENESAPYACILLNPAVAKRRVWYVKIKKEDGKYRFEILNIHKKPLEWYLLDEQRLTFDALDNIFAHLSRICKGRPYGLAKF